VPVSDKTFTGMSSSSWIRQMFEAGAKLKSKLGSENVFDLSIGNPVAEPPREFKNELLNIAREPFAGMHRYMPNAGYLHTRQAVARDLSQEFALDFNADEIVMTCGAAGALNVALKTVLNPGDEVVVISPYFPEYLNYVDNYDGKVCFVASGNEFLPQADEIGRAINKNTRAVIINSPNNPTGVLYSGAVLRDLASALKEKSLKFGRQIYLISDEPYRRLIYDGLKYPPPLHYYDDTIITCSYSKDLSLPGERLGYLAVGPGIYDKKELIAGMIYNNRVLGFVNAPALMQNLVARLQSVSAPVLEYERKRNYLYARLVESGYEVIKPQGAFYMFPKTPLENDVAFIEKLMSFGVLAVPGSGFGCHGYMRLSYCVEDRCIEGALEGLIKAIKD